MASELCGVEWCCFPASVHSISPWSDGDSQYLWLTADAETWSLLKFSKCFHIANFYWSLFGICYRSYILGSTETRFWFARYRASAFGQPYFRGYAVVYVFPAEQLIFWRWRMWLRVILIWLIVTKMYILSFQQCVDVLLLSFSSTLFRLLVY